MAYLATVRIIVADERRGLGVAGDPVRVVRQLWTEDGELMGEYDPEGRVPSVNWAILAALCKPKERA